MSKRKITIELPIRIMDEIDLWAKKVGVSTKAFIEECVVEAFHRYSKV